MLAGRVPKTLAASIHAEARRRGVSVSALVGEALAERFDSRPRDPLPVATTPRQPATKEMTR